MVEWGTGVQNCSSLTTPQHPSPALELIKQIVSIVSKLI